ncbi:MAG: response regulator, partial [Bacteroidales bacterium]|nr:response regulator [Bacteroidales bacterium]
MNSIKAEILLVEDDQNLGYMLQDYLDMEGFKVTWENNGQSGLNTFKSKQFDLCILDVMLPVKDGFTLAADIQKYRPGTPFLFLTARGREADRIRGLKLGADDYVTKPFSTEELKLRIDIILRRLGKAAEFLK